MWIALLALLSCNKDEPDKKTPAVGYAPDVMCPGGPGCANNDGELLVGVGVESVLPECFETFEDLDGNWAYSSSSEEFNDCGCDRLCKGDPGYPGKDEGEGDGVFQAVWLGGFQNARAASGVRDKADGLMGKDDGLWVHAVALRQGDTTLVILSVDSVGIMIDQVLEIRVAILAAGLDVDHVVVHSSHVHEGPDTMGIWGPTKADTGYDPDYQGLVKKRSLAAAKSAIKALQPASMKVGAVDMDKYHRDGTANLIRDSRDPWIVDPMLQTVQFLDKKGNTITSLVNWANHPETVADDNGLMTSDYAHALREVVEDGVVWNTESQNGVGGQAVLLNGTVGGMMTSLGVPVEDPDGVVRGSASFDKADSVGMLVGGMALDAIADGKKVADPKLSFAAKNFYLPIENTGFQAMFLLGVLDHRNAHNYDPDLPIDENNIPDVLSEVDVIDLGPIRMVTIPGEMLPELAIGGYDGKYTPKGIDIIADDNPNPPKLKNAPDGPYLKDMMGAEYNWVIGLGNDQIGYIVPEYNFITEKAAPYIFEAEGDHYEETNSLGPETAPRILAEAQALIEWKNAR